MIYVKGGLEVRREEMKMWNEYLTKFSTKIEGKLLEDLKTEINSKNDIVKNHYRKLMNQAKIQLNNLKNTLMDIFMYSIFDKYNWKLRAKGETPTKEFRRFKGTIMRFEDYLDEDLIYYAIKDECIEMGNINRMEIERIIKSSSYLAQGLRNLKNFELTTLANELKRHMIYNVSKDLPDKLYRIKSQHYGTLLMTRSEDHSTAIEHIKTSILCLPIGEQHVLNMFLYLSMIVLNLWEIKSRSNIYAPLDHGVSEVILSLGLTDKRIETLEYESLGFKVYKTISEVLFPEEPSKMMVTRAIAERWCYQREIKICDECWLNKVCPKEY
ncbi:MAG: hypothetical protein QXI93_02985 [Candidatus Methanomethylicia archaeon]